MDDTMKELGQQPNNDKINRPAEDIGRSRTDQGMKEVLHQLGPEQDTQTQTVTATVERTPVDRVDPHAENIVDVRTKLGAEQSIQPSRPDRTNEQIAQYHEVKNLVANAWKDTVVSEGDQTTMTRREVVKKGLVAGLLVKLGWKTIHINNHPQSSITTTEGSGAKSNVLPMNQLHIVNASEDVNAAGSSTEQPATVSEKNEKDLTPLEKEFDELLVPTLFSHATEEQLVFLRKQIIPLIENINNEESEILDNIIQERLPTINEVGDTLGLDNPQVFENIAMAIIKAESRNVADIQSYDNSQPEERRATGLMQIIPNLHNMSVEALKDPTTNITKGMQLLKSAYDTYPDLMIAVSTYHDGPGNMAYEVGRYLDNLYPDEKRTPEMQTDIQDMLNFGSSTRPEAAHSYVANGDVTFPALRDSDVYDDSIKMVAKEGGGVDADEYKVYPYIIAANFFAILKRRQGQPVLPAA